MCTPTIYGSQLTHRDRAMLRAAAEGRAQLTGGCEPDLYVDGLPCCDQPSAHNIVHMGLLVPVQTAALGQCVRAVLTEAGRAALTD